MKIAIYHGLYIIHYEMLGYIYEYFKYNNYEYNIYAHLINGGQDWHTYYNNILLVSTSCWEAMTPYQEKFGNMPDHCKVPLINLKTRAIKILDFEEKENKNEKNFETQSPSFSFSMYWSPDFR